MHFLMIFTYTLSAGHLIYAGSSQYTQKTLLVTLFLWVGVPVQKVHQIFGINNDITVYEMLKAKFLMEAKGESA